MGRRRTLNAHRQGPSAGVARLAGIVAVVLGSAFAAGPVQAAPIPGATYTGVAADGATVQLTVSSDGTLVSNYAISYAPATGCQIYAGGRVPVWQGAPIVQNAFEYNLLSAIMIQGSFPGAQTAAGTLRLYTAATPATKACDTGTVSWRATTTATPPGGGGGGGGHHRRMVMTRVSLHKVKPRTRSTRIFAGQIKSSDRACLAGRKVTLWRFSRRIASTTTRSHGTFAFTLAHAAGLRGRSVRASVAGRTLSTAVCGAASSKFIQA